MNTNTISAFLVFILVSVGAGIVGSRIAELNKPIITAGIQQSNEIITNTIDSKNPTSSVEFAPALKEENLNELPERVSSTTWTKQEIKQYIETKAIEYGVSTSIALFIAEHESNFEPWRVGDDDKTCRKTGKPVRSRGLFQWNDCAWPEITNEIAFDVVSSTILAMEQMEKGNYNIWSAWRFRCLLYDVDC